MNFIGQIKDNVKYFSEAFKLIENLEHLELYFMNNILGYNKENLEYIGCALV